MAPSVLLLDMRKWPIKAWVLLFGISTTLLVIGHQVGHRDGLLAAALLALSINGILFFYGDLRLIPLFRAVELEGQDPWGLLQQIQTLSERARIQPPKLFIMPSDSVQTLVLGRSANSGRIFITEGLLRSLSESELHTVLAFDIACIRNLSTLSFTVGSALADAVLSVGQWVDGVLRHIVGSPKKKTALEPLHLGTLMVAPLAAAIIRLTVSRKEYLLADSLAAELAGDGRLLAQTLWKLHSYALTRPLLVPPAMAPFFMVNPLTRHTWSRYFHAQPAIQERIRSLVGYYPI